MILSKTCDYAMRAVFYIAAQKERKFIPIREVSEKLDISFHFLTKILQVLTRAHILVSFKGPNGGIALACPAESISLSDISKAIDGSKIYEECILGLDQCGDENPCPLHNEWKRIRDQIQNLFDKTTFAEVAEKINCGEFRITNLLKKNK
ncbi:MAG TPA: Rrf2 family transcriptional regulator [Bacteroidetes bacterium]|nr:Rrf2 family transcriptional regulator [Bacteroidota bacterium]